MGASHIKIPDAHALELLGACQAFGLKTRVLLDKATLLHVVVRMYRSKGG